MEEYESNWNLELHQRQALSLPSHPEASKGFDIVEYRVIFYQAYFMRDRNLYEVALAQL